LFYLAGVDSARFKRLLNRVISLNYL
jgi:hypothetical protein